MYQSSKLLRTRRLVGGNLIVGGFGYTKYFKLLIHSLHHMIPLANMQSHMMSRPGQMWSFGDSCVMQCKLPKMGRILRWQSDDYNYYIYCTHDSFHRIRLFDIVQVCFLTDRDKTTSDFMCCFNSTIQCDTWLTSHILNSCLNQSVSMMLRTEVLFTIYSEDPVK